MAYGQKEAKFRIFATKNLFGAFVAVELCVIQVERNII